MSSRIDTLLAMAERHPDDPRYLFGLALEFLRMGRFDEGISHLRRYLAIADDEGNGWGRLAEALRERGDPEGAREAYRKGIEAANRHRHPTMAESFEEALAEFDD